MHLVAEMTENDGADDREEVEECDEERADIWGELEGGAITGEVDCGEEEAKGF